MDLRHAAAALGGNIIGANRIAAPGPNHSPRDRSLVVKFDPKAPEGFVTHSHSGDDWRECRDYVRTRLGLPDWQPGDEQDRRVPRSRRKAFDAATVIDQPRTWTNDEIARINRARRIWAEGKNPQGTLAERYLSEHRGLQLTDDVAGTTLRFHACCPWRDENTGGTIFVPALIAAFRQIANNQVTAIHRIRLNEDGCKFNRMMLGIVEQAAVKLTATAEILGVAEGVETAMAARELGFKSVWAMGSAGNISKLPVIDGVKHLIVFGKRDAGASARAIAICGERWRATGRRVQVVMPTVGKDMNDALLHQTQKRGAA